MIIGYIEDFLKQCNKVGIHDDAAILGLIGVVVAYFIQKQLYHYKKHYNMISKAVEKIVNMLEHLTTEHDKIDNYHLRCVNDDGTILAQRQTLTEKVDNLEDHLKEIKKQLLFK